MKIRMFQIDAFADALFQGNPAGVCPLDTWLPDSTMQSIAAENNLAETAFFVGSKGHYSIRWFTPEIEIDLCGHATLASASMLFSESEAHASELEFDSRSGPLRVLREGDWLTLDFPLRAVEECETPPELVMALDTEPVSCHKGVDYLVELKDERAVRKLRPDFRRLAELECRGVMVTAPGDHTDFVCRFFAPRMGIDEDPVTGSAYCTLAPHWAAKLGKPKLSARQLSRRGGSVHCRIEEHRVFISGKAILYLDGFIHL